ncbi:cytoplasmic dynein 2 intermediate chain 2-like isoform X2 [Leptidea sinapis]|uniref:cytoplasmic dynein 2 intermediate chain 2-like isoform X2 n=1 Tax=Leptidea sinapis TaxID=189913 RepID=UPI0021C29169|nr:cytoplasmic dynein 2 intermediate chain 2-like isoform X2 [Leptidea sinapis]
MSGLSGFDSEAVGFESIASEKRTGTTSGTQTKFEESGVGCQTNLSCNKGCTASAEDFTDDELKEYPPPGLNEFLRRVVPTMMDQLNQSDKLYNSSDSEDEELLTAKLFQEIKVQDGSGDHQSAILSVTWSSAGNSLAVSIGQLNHETWCQSSGLIKVFTLKRAGGERFVHSLDISENNCVTCLKYHPSVAALLAYGSTSGEVVLCNLMNGNMEEGTQLASPAGCHGSRRVTSLKWADAPLANTFLVMQITNKGKRRGAADQVLFSAGCDGTLNAWQVNASSKVFENIICYNINASRKTSPPNITCFDFIKSFPLRPSDDKRPDDIFVVGTDSGKIFLCRIKSGVSEDPVFDVLDGHNTFVLDVEFSYQKAGVFVSVSIDSELRVYDVNQRAPVLSLEKISCMSWLPTVPCVVLGLAQHERQLIQVYNMSSGKPVRVDGLLGNACITCLAVSQMGSSSCRIAAGDREGRLRVWELPTRRFRMSAEDLDF